MSTSLLMTRRFAPLFWTQFFAAFSDNFLKTSLVFLLLFHIGGADAEALITLAAAVFIAPYFFLSALGGELADRYDKAKVAQRLKLTEIGIAFIAVVGFGLHSVPLLFFALFLFGVSPRCSVRSSTAFFPTISPARSFPRATRWWRARPSSPSCSAPSSAAWRPRMAATPPISRS